MIVDSAAIASLAEVYRREQTAGRCLDADQLAAMAVCHLHAIGYRRTEASGSHQPVPQADLPAGATAEAVAIPPAVAAVAAPPVRQPPSAPADAA